MKSFLHRPWILALGLFIALGALGACGGGGGGSSGSGAGAGATGIDVLVGDAPSDELLAFRARVDGVVLDISGGGTTQNLLAGPVDVEFLGLQTSLLWLASADLAPATYTGARLSFVPGSYHAVAQDGSAVTVAASSHELAVAFTAPYVHGANGYQRVALDLDLVQSLSGSVAAPPLAFAPSGSAALSVGSSSDDYFAIDEVKGVVQSVDANQASFVIDAFVDADLAVPLGAVTVKVSAATLGLDDDGVAFGSAQALLAALVPGATLVEVHGLLAAGVIHASKVEIEDGGLGGGASSYVAKIEGRIQALDGDSFTLLIQEIEQGASIVLPVLASYGNPPAIEVGYTPSTPVFLDSNTPASTAALAVGTKVKVKFAAFVAPPFPAAKIELEDAHPEFEGFVTSIAGLPASFTMHVQASEPAVVSGQIASSSTDVQVLVAGAPVFLGTDGKPALATNDLLVGMKVEPQGLLSGPPNAPTIDASKVKVFPGRLEGTVASIQVASSAFVVTGASIDDPFGAALGGGPIDVRLAPNCVFEDDAGSAASFFALFQSLGAGAVLDVRVEGIATGQPNQVRAYVVRAKVEGD